MIDYALHYASHGWPLFPLVPGGKTPLIPAEKGGRGCRSATTSRAVVEQWWLEHPDANIGIATGIRSELLVIDVDPRNAADWLAHLTTLELPETYTVRTASGGFHLYFRYPPGCGITIGANLLPGIDWRGEGGYVVAPGSVVNGACYTVVRQMAMAMAPRSLLHKLRETKKKPRVVQRDATGTMVIPQATRNTQLFKIGCALRRFGVDFNAILEALRAINRDHCAPVMDDAEVMKIATSAAMYIPESAGAR